MDSDCSNIAAPFAGYLADSVPLRYTLMFTGPLSCAALVLSAFAPTLGILIIGQGAMMGKYGLMLSVV